MGPPSVAPDWYSTVFGLYYSAGGFVAALGLMPVLVIAAQRSRRLLRVGESHVYALGRLLFELLVQVRSPFCELTVVLRRSG